MSFRDSTDRRLRTWLRTHQPAASEITPQALVNRRRALLQLGQLGQLGTAGLALAAGSLPAMARAAPPAPDGPPLAALPSKVAGARAGDALTPRRDSVTYNNFVEFGPDKDDPALSAGALVTRPWSLLVDGEVGKPRRFDLDELLQLAPLEERIYRLRCVEGWSMVIPWIGWSLAELIRRVEPTGNAKFVEFTSAVDLKTMPGAAAGLLPFPYFEGLRLDEALHPLAMLVFGSYGQVLPKPNGAPLRLAVPWKYGFKSAKSLVRIRLVERMPRTLWMQEAPDEYGFYANVNPQVDHPRWSQADERRIGAERGFWALLRPRIPTRMFNGYAEQVASLYAGMDLKRNF